MALTMVTNGSTTAAGAITPATSGILAVNPVARSTTVILSAAVTSSTAGTGYVEYSLDDPSIPGGPAMTWALLSSATALLSSVISAAPYSWTILSPIGALRVNSTGGSTGGVTVFTMKALQSITA